MSDQKSSNGGLAGLGRSIVTALPPGMLVVVLLNAALLWLVLQSVEQQSEQRLAILMKVIEKCLGSVHP